MTCIAAEYLFIAHQLRIQQPGRFHLIQLLPDTVVIVTEFGFKIAQIILLCRVQEELQQ